MGPGAEHSITPRRFHSLSGDSASGRVTGTHPPKLSVGDDRAIDPANNISDAFWSNLSGMLAIPRNFAMVASPERC